MYRWIYRNLVYPVYHSAIGSGALAAIRDLASHDALTMEELRIVTRDKLRALLIDAGTNVPYYRDAIKQIECAPQDLVDTENFCHLPVLTKSIIREQGKRLETERLDGNRLDPNSTSGSTGSPLEFFTDVRSKAFRKATVIRNRKWLGMRVGDSVVNIWGSPIDQRRMAALRGRIHSLATRVTLLSAYSMSDNDMEGYAAELRRISPSLLVGYPSVLSEFARFCDERSIRIPEMRAIICSAEALFDPQRDIIERVFASPVYNRYGCREVGDIAQEVPGQSGLVVNSDRIFLEIVDDQDKPCPPGVFGEVLVTDLDNYGMPLIRYRIGDSACWAGDDDRVTALPYPILASVEGRSLDVTVSPSGIRVGGTFWTILFRKRPGIAMFQVVQDTRDKMHVYFVKRPDVASIDIDYFRKKISETFGEKLFVEFEEVDRIAPDAAGKRRIVVSRISRNHDGSGIGTGT